MSFPHDPSVCETRLRNDVTTPELIFLPVRRSLRRSQSHKQARPLFPPAIPRSLAQSLRVGLSVLQPIPQFKIIFCPVENGETVDREKLLWHFKLREFL